jgi:hypothetical protein
MHGLRRRLTYSNVAATLALVIAVGGGSAYAANTVFSSDIVDDQVYSADVRNDTLTGGGLSAADLRAHSVGSSEVTNNALTTGDIRNDSLPGGGLTGADIRNQSGVDTCTHGTVRLGELCFRASNSAPQTWNQAVGDCGSRDLRLPSFAEAVALAVQYNLPNLSDQELFWTGEYYAVTSGPRSLGVSDSGGYLDSDQQSTYRTVCVTTPTN